MLNWLKQLDELLRGDRTRVDQLSDGRVRLPLSIYVPAALALGATYGLFMGWYAIGNADEGRYTHALAVMLKVPLLFLFTLAITFPSLYVFNALVGCRLDFKTTLRLLVAAIVVNLAVGASLGPILGFFTLSTKSYPFMVLLNVVLLGIAGVIGLAFLLRTLRALARVSVDGGREDKPVESGEEPRLAPAAEDRRADIEAASSEQTAAFIFRVWVFIYAVVGMQMSWIMRPFIGAPGTTLSVFRPREGNFFAAVIGAISRLSGW